MHTIATYRELIKSTNHKHGMSSTREYKIWHKMMERCYNPNHHAFFRYGGRGITICYEWRTDVLKFIRDVGLSPGLEYSIDRKDTNANYEPGNVRWATVHQQGANKRNSRPVPGVSWDTSKKTWKAMLTINKTVVLNKRFKLYDDAVKARKQAENEWGIIVD